MQIEIIYSIISGVVLLILGGLVAIVFKKFEKVTKIDEIEYRVRVMDEDIKDIRKEIKGLTGALQEFIVDLKVLVTSLGHHKESHGDFDKHLREKQNVCLQHFVEIEKRLEKLEGK
jgi:uncharacterized protein YoxC